MTDAPEELKPGQQFGHLTVVDRIHKKHTNGKEGQQYICKCVCGRTCIIPRSSLVLGLRKSCGCRGTQLPPINTADSHTALYYKWQTIRHSKTPHDPAWDIFANFKIWSGLHHYSPDKRLIITDPENNRYWGPDSCEWVDSPTFDEIQAERVRMSRRKSSRKHRELVKAKKAKRDTSAWPKFRRGGLVYPYKGQVAHTIKEWSEILGIAHVSLYKRLEATRTGDLEEAFQAPFKKNEDILSKLDEYLESVKKRYPGQVISPQLVVELLPRDGGKTPKEDLIQDSPESENPIDK